MLSNCPDIFCQRTCWQSRVEITVRASSVRYVLAGTKHFVTPGSLTTQSNMYGNLFFQLTAR